MHEIYDPIDKYTTWRLRADAKAPPKPWQWPLARIGDREPTILGEHVTPKRRGVEIGFAVASYDDALFVPVHAVQSGEVAYALQQSDDFAVTIEHDDPTWATHYAHLSKIFVTRQLGRHRLRRQRVRAGDVIGYAATSPLHVRFELYKCTDDRGYVAIDPRAHLESWLESSTTATKREAA